MLKDRFSAHDQNDHFFRRSLPAATSGSRCARLPEGAKVMTLRVTLAVRNSAQTTHPKPSPHRNRRAKAMCSKCCRASSTYLYNSDRLASLQLLRQRKTPNPKPRTCLPAVSCVRAPEPCFPRIPGRRGYRRSKARHGEAGKGLGAFCIAQCRIPAPNRHLLDPSKACPFLAWHFVVYRDLGELEPKGMRKSRFVTETKPG